MKNTKQKIQDTAIELFNEKGYSNVSLREIAKKVGTTIGNLTYHYKRKEDLIIAIVSDLNDDYASYFSNQVQGKKTLNNLIDSFKKAQVNHQKYNFYFKNMGGIIDDSSYFFELNKEFQTKLYDFHLSCLLELQKDDIIKKEFSLKILESFAFSITMLIANWSDGGGPGNNSEINKFSLVNTMIDLIKPYVNAFYQTELDNYYV